MTRPGDYRATMRLRLVTISAVLLLCGCAGTDTSTTPSAPPAASQAPASSPAVRDAKATLDAIRAAGLRLTSITAQDEDSDPNNLIGRPGQYTSRASADLPGADPSAKAGSVDRGVVAEGFPNADGAQARADHIQNLLKQSPVLGAEYHYLAGAVLVRVSGKVKPSQAKLIEQAVAGM